MRDLGEIRSAVHLLIDGRSMKQVNCFIRILATLDNKRSIGIGRLEGHDDELKAAYTYRDVLLRFPNGIVLPIVVTGVLDGASVHFKTRDCLSQYVSSAMGMFHE